LRHAISDVLVQPAPRDGAIPIQVVTREGCAAALAGLGEAASASAALHEFTGKAAQVLLLADGRGGVAGVLFGIGAEASVRAMTLRALPAKLPPGLYAYQALPDGIAAAAAALAFALGSYGFDRYKAEPSKARPRLALAAGVNLAAVERIAHACALVRDMVNTPANDMGPGQIESIARLLANTHGATLEIVTGEALLESGYPAVHAVGRAATPDRAPRMLELTWSAPDATADAPLIALVGKGVAFDTGGLDIKPSSGMRWMKKDMGGAAHALALGHMIMDARTPIRLKVLIAAVENAISADAMRPGDVIASRKGLSIEIGNTDAEGRLILADALTRAGESTPDLTIDLATLTGAARVALGPEVIPFYTWDEALAAEIAAAATAVDDPLWRMPLWPGYAEALNSDIADLKNDPDAWAQAGSVTAALFLKRFAPQSGAWVHLDIFAWNPRSRPGWPMGAEAQAIRALFTVIQARYGPTRDGQAAEP
jgi:leucyl aminopeptidase